MNVELLVKDRVELDGTRATATFSGDMRYRYKLSRKWGKGPVLVCILLNPSTGDEFKLETTTAGLRKRAENWGYDGIVVYNLFALISTDPQRIYEHDDPIGKYNDSFIRNLIDDEPEGSIVLCAWGNHGRLMNRDDEVVKLLPEELYSLGVNKTGTPRHPLHMAHSIKPIPWLNKS